MVAGVYERFGFEKIEETQDDHTIWQYDLETNGPIENTYIDRTPVETGAII
jgi:hypothetical protein